MCCNSDSDMQNKVSMEVSWWLKRQQWQMTYDDSGYRWGCNNNDSTNRLSYNSKNVNKNTRIISKRSGWIKIKQKVLMHYLETKI